MNGKNPVRPDPEKERFAPRMTLAMLVERVAAETSDRDRNFVRNLSKWLHTNAPLFRLELIESMGLQDAVITFQMRRDVDLVITGHLTDPYAEITIKIAEDEFPSVWVALAAESSAEPYTICTLDYARKHERLEILGDLIETGRTLAQGTVCSCLVISTIGQDTYVRLAADGSDTPWTAPLRLVRFLSDTAQQRG